LKLNCKFCLIKIDFFLEVDYVCKKHQKKKEPDYSKTVIYKIQCKDPNIWYTYGGHSVDLERRRIEHRSRCYNKNADHYSAYVYQFIRENGG